MTSSFSINHIFEENLEISFTINNGTFNTIGEEFIIQHFAAIQNLQTLDSWTHTVLNTDEDNYFEVEYRFSFDTTTWTNWITMPNDFNNFINPNSSENIWLQIKYTLIGNGCKFPILNELNINGTRKIAEIFQPVSILPGESPIYTNADTYKVFDIQDFNLYLKDGNISDLEVYYRFTQTQGRQWTEWKILTADNLKTTKFERLKFCNFQFAFKNIGLTPISLYDLELLGEFQNVTANYKTIAKFGLKSQCNPLAIKPAPTGPCDTDCLTGTSTSTSCCDDCIPCSESLTPWNPCVNDCNLNSNKYTQLNDRKLWQTQIQLYEELNKFVEGTNSWKVSYLLTDADQKGIDHVMHEQTVHNVIAMRDIQIIVPDNQFPVDTVNFSGLDLDLIQSFEVHILKDSFKKIFGVEFRPSKKDVLYLCDLNQLWEVEQMFPKRGFMNAEIYYRVMLKKYNDRLSRQYANTPEGQQAKDMINELTKYTTLDNLFGIDEHDEIKRNTKDNLSIVDRPSQQYTDTPLLTIVKRMHDKTEIIKNEIWNSTLTVSKSTYKMPIKSKGLKLVEYNYQDNTVEKGEKRAISFWFKTEDYNPTYYYSLFNNYNETNLTGYKVFINQGALSFVFNNSTYSMPIPNFLNEVWYSILVNFDQVQRKLELAIYNRANEIGIGLNSSRLVLFNKLLFDIEPDTFTHNEIIFIGGNDTNNIIGNRKNWYITNIRIWNNVIQKTNRHNVLNENVVTDAHLTLLIDNAEQILKLPNYSNPGIAKEEYIPEIIPVEPCDLNTIITVENEDISDDDDNPLLYD